MTTSVTVKAHCSKDKQVRVTVTNAGQPVEEFTLQDGEVQERVVYDERALTVREELKG